MESQKEAIIRPIALASHVKKLMVDQMVNDERRGMVAKYQGRFRRGGGTMDPVLYLDNISVYVSVLHKQSSSKLTVVLMLKKLDMDRGGADQITLAFEGKLFSWVM